MNYYVLFHFQSKTNTLLKLLKEIECFDVVYLQYEFYRRDKKTIECKPAYPGYIFVKTDLNQEEFDMVLYEKKEISGLYRQLKKENGAPALNKEEIQFLELFFDEDGILRMSYGKCKDRRIEVEAGPLKNLERFIIKYDKHNRNVTLDIRILNKRIKCGFEENSINN